MKKRRVWYQIEAKGMWWCGNKIGWVKGADLNSTEYKLASCSRYMRTAKRAFSHAQTLPPGSVVIRWFRKKGKRYMQEFIKR